VRERRILRGAAAAGIAAALAASIGAVCLTGCAPARYRLAGDEARDARKFFASAPRTFPAASSFSGIAWLRGSPYPFVAGVSSRTSPDETVGFYDPLGRAVLFLANDGARLSLSPGPVAAELPEGSLPVGEFAVAAGPLSLAGILSGAPGYPVGGGTPSRADDGGWVLADGRQTLFSDPSRRHLARAEYELAGVRVAVSYPGREDPGPPPVVTIETRGAKIFMRRDSE
jgi:hypothetical protein